MRMFLLVLFCVVCVPVISFAQAKSESLTITTYYPSPAGVYRSVRLVPTSQPVEPILNRPGSLYFNNTTEQVYYYKNNVDTWQPLAGGGGAGAGPVSLKCTWSFANFVSSCTPPAAPSGWTSLGTGCAASAVEPVFTNIHYMGYCERWIARTGATGLAISLKCAWGGSSSSCVPPACPAGWTSAGTGCSASGMLASTPYSGYSEQWCVN